MLQSMSFEEYINNYNARRYQVTYITIDGITKTGIFQEYYCFADHSAMTKEIFTTSLIADKNIASFELIQIDY